MANGFIKIMDEHGGFRLINTEFIKQVKLYSPRSLIYLDNNEVILSMNTFEFVCDAIEKANQ
jgi:hypothetical protein